MLTCKQNRGRSYCCAGVRWERNTRVGGNVGEWHVAAGWLLGIWKEMGVTCDHYRGLNEISKHRLELDLYDKRAIRSNIGLFLFLRLPSMQRPISLPHVPLFS
jgi:hypothetical protein